METQAIEVNSGGVGDTDTKRVVETENVPPVNDSWRNPPFLPRTLHRRFHSNEAGPPCLKVHIATVTDNKHAVETRCYERRRNIRCALCLTKPSMKSRQALWIHCLRKHRKFNPELVRTSDGTAHLLLNQRNRDCDDDSFPVAKKMGVGHVLYCHCVHLNHFSVSKPPNNVHLPTRTYYDSVFKTPKPEALWLLDFDSDDEAKDHLSLLPYAEAEINDYTDVAPNQKRFMKIWNHFLAHTSDGIIVAPKHLPSICLKFARYFADHGSCSDDEEQFIRFLMNLMDENFLGCLQMEQIMTVYRHARKSLPREDAAVSVSYVLSSTNYEQSSCDHMLSTMTEDLGSYGADESDSHESAEINGDTFFLV